MRKFVLGIGLAACSTLLCAQAPQPAPAPPALEEEDFPPLEDVPLPPVPEIVLPPLPPVEPVKPLSYEEYREGAFRAAQWAFRTDAAAALDRLAARFAGGGDSVGRLENELQGLAERRRSVERALADSFQREGPGIDAQRREMRSRSEALEAQLVAKAAEIETRFPRYSELVRPRAYDFETVRALLRPDEALLLIVNADDASYLFAVSRERYQWFRTADLPRSEVERAVGRLRASLAEPAGGPLGGSRTEVVPPFDRGLAYRLYKGLIEPAREIVGGKRVLMTITSGELATLPLNLLVTDPPSGADDRADAFATTRWLADRHVLAALPAVSSLVALRCLLVPAAKRSSGCGSMAPPPPAQSPAPASPIVLAAAGAPALDGTDVARRRGPGSVDEAFHDGRPLADPEYLRQRYPRLPGAAAELASLERLYGERAHVRKDKVATERAVKEEAPFRTARYVVFATHGVFAARAATYGEPGLVFTPPAAGAETERDDGFLAASEVAQLRFNADLVVLSACNTASSDGRPGGEGLSGLARAFFFAGARSLLVSHWEVDDEATSMLMQEAFDGIGGQGRSPGEAVSRAMGKVRADPRFRHPRHWAAFSLVGEAS